MDFYEIVQNRQSCRRFDPEKTIEKEKLERIIEAARLSPSACNAQPYHITICENETAKRISKATTGMGINSFTKDAPVMIVISEDSYNKTAALGSKLKGIDYRSLDIGILCSHIVFASHEEGLSSCIIGWIDDKKVREIIGIDKKCSLIVALGYAKADDKLRNKKRKSTNELVTYIS